MNLSSQSRIPTLDLHGESKDIAIILVKEFIYDNYRLKNKQINIVHGIGSGILKTAVHEELRKNKYVQDYKVDFFNLGTTMVDLIDK